MIRTILTVALIALAGVTFSAEPAQASVCPDAEPIVGRNVRDFACGVADCLEEGLPNIMVTCL